MTCFLRYTRHTEPTEPTILCLGASGVGKTLLLEKLRNVNKSNENLIPTIPTTGTNLYTMKLGRKGKYSVILRELGGAMAPLWRQYFADGNAVMFLVDSSNSFQVSASTILLIDMLNHSSLENCPVLVIFNKCDWKQSVMSVAQIQDVMHLPAILKHAKQKITVMEASALTEQGLQNIRDWIQVNTLAIN